MIISRKKFNHFRDSTAAPSVECVPVLVKDLLTSFISRSTVSDKILP